MWTRFDCALIGVALPLASSARAEDSFLDSSPDLGLFTASPCKALPQLHVSAKRHLMEEERIARALARIEAATRRIEDAASSSPSTQADQSLIQRHENLRKEALAALGQIDELIRNLEA